MTTVFARLHFSNDCRNWSKEKRRKINQVIIPLSRWIRPCIEPFLLADIMRTRCFEWRHLLGGSRLNEQWTFAFEVDVNILIIIKNGNNDDLHTPKNNKKPYTKVGAAQLYLRNKRWQILTKHFFQNDANIRHCSRFIGLTHGWSLHVYIVLFFF